MYHLSHSLSTQPDTASTDWTVSEYAETHPIDKVNDNSLLSNDLFISRRNNEKYHKAKYSRKDDPGLSFLGEFKFFN